MATKLAIALLISPVACLVLLLTILMNVSTLNIEKKALWSQALVGGLVSTPDDSGEH